MEQVTITHIEDIAAYAGAHEIPGIRFKPARQALGVSSWGMNVLELDAHCEGYPEHDHASDGHEEVYVVLRGEAVLRVGEAEHVLTEGAMVRVPGGLRRKFITRAHGVTLLALGGTPGKAYAPSMGG
ncbi:MAG: cupin domain-containing protein [Polyangiales bacterium]